VLGLATSLVAYPMDEALALRGEARSVSCGSTLSLGLALDEAGAIAGVGLAAHACAIGQAAAAIFARAAIGQHPQTIAEAEAAIAGWLAASARGEAATLPDWPGLDAIAAAAAFPARHGAILLAWRAALSALALSTRPAQG
jgi:NifU-like protein involved in Fe-S cluster formation